jgi:hypothetical protein
MSAANEREAFEAWAKPHSLYPVKMCDQSNGVNYAAPDTQLAWSAWRAATSDTAALRESHARLVTKHTELSEVSKLAWRALCDAEAVLNTLDGDDVLESMNLDELRKRVTACVGNLFSVLGLPVSDFCAALAAAQKVKP